MIGTPKICVATVYAEVVPDWFLMFCMEQNYLLEWLNYLRKQFQTQQPKWTELVRLRDLEVGNDQEW